MQKALTTKAMGRRRLPRLSALSKKGKLVAYEAATLKGAKAGEIQVGPNGEKLAREEREGPVSVAKAPVRSGGAPMSMTKVPAYLSS